MEQSLTGKGIGVAILDTGIYPHIDFDNRIVGFFDVISHKKQMYDDNGHGTHIAGIVAGSGRGSGGRIRGAAPGAHLVAVKILSADGGGNCKDAVLGMEWILENRKKYNIRVVNFSIGTTKKSDENQEDAMERGAERLWEEGLVVVAATGNNGPENGTVTAPGTSRKIITVGAYDELLVANKGKMTKYFSGAGPTRECVMKPEIVARGNQILSCKNRRTGYLQRSGSSMAAPFVSGMIARVLQKHPDMTPKDVKLLLHDKAVDLGMPKNIQGWGTLDDTLFL